MAASTGLSDTLETTYTTHMCGGAAPTALTSPTMLALGTTTSTNTTFGTEVSATNTNYTRQNANLAGSTTNTAGAGAAGFSQRSNTAPVSMFGAGVGTAGTQTLTGVMLYDSAGTPVRVGYQNFASNVSVAQGATYVIATGSLVASIS